MEIQRVIIPVAIIESDIHLHLGKEDAILLSALIKAIHETSSIGSLFNILPFPRSMTTALIAKAASLGLIEVRANQLVLPGNVLIALHGNSLDAFLGINRVQARCRWGIDLIKGNVFRLDWVMDKKRDDPYPGDMLLAPRLDDKQILEKFYKYPISRLAEMAKWQIFSAIVHTRSINEEDIPRLALNSGNIAVLDKIDIAVPLAFHSIGDSSRYLVDTNVPQYVVEIIEKSMPEILALQKKEKTSRSNWDAEQSLKFLMEIEEHWNKAKWNLRSSASEEIRRTMAISTLSWISKWHQSFKEPEKSVSDVEFTEVVIGPASSHVDSLMDWTRTVKRRCVVLTSFLNHKYADWVARIFTGFKDNVEVHILYGHANDETPEEQQITIKEYFNTLSPRLSTNIKLVISPTTVRSHEKIFISDDSSALLGSLNLCSTVPNSGYLEANVIMRSKTLVKELGELLSTEVGDQEKKFIGELISDLPETKPVPRKPITHRLEAMESLMKSIVDQGKHEPRDWRKWREQLTGLKDDLWTHFDSPRFSIITGDEIRDVLFEQVEHAKSSVLISCDRVNAKGLDSAFASHLLSNGKVGRILWGREDPNWNLSDQPEDQAQVKEASEVISKFIAMNPQAVLSSEKPMHNHSKVLIFDDNRFVISSDNFLAHGGQPDEKSSREIGILIESPLLTRQLLGDMYLHAPGIGSRFSGEDNEHPWDLFELIRQEVNTLRADKEIEAPENPQLILFGIESRFKEVTLDGQIKMDSLGREIVLDHTLNNRWSMYRKLLGENKGRPIKRDALPMFLEEIFKRAHEMIGVMVVMHPNKSFSVFPRGMHEPIALRDSIESSETGVKAAYRILIEIIMKKETVEYGPVNETEILSEARKTLPWFEPGKWDMTDEDFLNLFEESQYIKRLGNGECRRIPEAERRTIRPTYQKGQRGVRNTICSNCGRKFHLSNGAKEQDHLIGINGGVVCYECRDRLKEEKTRNELTAGQNVRIKRTTGITPDQTISDTDILPVRKDDSGRDRFATVCSVCNKPMDIPFKPQKGRQYFCNEHLHRKSGIEPVRFNREGRPFFAATCFTCGEACEVPFPPKPGRPVYCLKHRPEK